MTENTTPEPKDPSASAQRAGADLAEPEGGEPSTRVVRVFDRHRALRAGATADPGRPYIARFEQQRRSLDPLRDRDFIRRTTGDVNEGLIRRTTARYEQPDASRSIREQVENAAASRIAEHWRTNAVTNAFARDAAWIAGEAHRLLRVYGPTIAEQSHFLTEYRANLKLFRASGLGEANYERADLLARLVLPATFATGFDRYARINVEVVRRYVESAISELEVNFDCDGNPVYVWEAFAMARRYGIPVPDWVSDSIADAADRIMDIREDVANGTPIGKEAERVGKAFGFGMDGPGPGGRFKYATVLERDRNIYVAVRERIAAGTKLDFAYDDVARALDVSRSTVVRSYLRISRLNGEVRDDAQDSHKVS